MKTGLVPKREQPGDIEWAKKMLQPPNVYQLVDISKHMWTKELIETAIKNGRASLNVLPEAERTPELCRAAVDRDWTELQWVPEALRTHEFLMHTVSWNPTAYREALHYSRRGRSKEPYSAEDVELALESVYPKEYVMARVANLKDGPDCTTEQEKRDCAMQYLPTPAVPSRMLEQALAALLREMRSDG